MGVLNPLYNTSIYFPNIIFTTPFRWAFAVINYVFLCWKSVLSLTGILSTVWCSCNLSLYLHLLVVFSLTSFSFWIVIYGPNFRNTGPWTVMLVEFPCFGVLLFLVVLVAKVLRQLYHWQLWVEYYYIL